jgi:hypothetical protein
MKLNDMELNKFDNFISIKIQKKYYDNNKKNKKIHEFISH